jgi:branched-chain amino acid transport system permease protein
LKDHPLNLRGLLAFILVIAVLALLPVLGLPQTWLLYIFLFFIYLTLANMWNLLSGYCGLISLCQPAFIGLGGYTLVICTWSGLPFYLGILCGALVAVLFSMLISPAVFRLRGIYFAIGTLVVPEALRVIFLNWRPVGEQIHGKGAGYMIKGIEGLSMTHIYWFAIVIGIASVFIIRIMLNSKIGLGLAAIRDNDDAASSSGINISPSVGFSMKWTITMILAVVIGGISTEEGPIIGTVIIVFLHFLLARYAGVSLIIQGVLLIIIMLLVPHGIMGFFRKTRAYQSLLRFAAARMS